MLGVIPTTVWHGKMMYPSQCRGEKIRVTGGTFGRDLSIKQLQQLTETLIIKMKRGAFELLSIGMYQLSSKYSAINMI